MSFTCQQDLSCRCCLQLWHSYLRERQKAVRGLSVVDRPVGALNNTYKRALVSMHKMPRIWLEYLVSLVTSASEGRVNCSSTLGHSVKMCRKFMFLHGVMYMLTRSCWMQEFLVSQGLVTETRRAFDSALCALPITQHERIWQIYLVSMILQHAAPCRF